MGDFVTVMSGPFQGTMGYIDLIDDDIAYIIEHQEGGNVSTFGNGISSRYQLTYTDPMSDYSSLNYMSIG